VQPALALLDGPDILVIVGIFVLLFGASKIPQLARSLGRAKGEFEKGARESREETAREAAPPADDEDARVRRAAKELGIPTEGRALSDIKRDMKAKMA
jgi:sec-independent protein translocase protein TatA